MADLSSQAGQLLEKAGKEAARKKALFTRGPDYDVAAEDAQRAANMFKIERDYGNAAKAFQLAATCQMQAGRKQQAATSLQDAVNCLNIVDPGQANNVLEDLIRLSAEAGRFMQAGKACVQQAAALTERGEWEPAVAAYARAAELFRTESNAESNLREARLCIAQLSAQHLGRYIESAAIFEEVGVQCSKIALLSFHARGHFLRAFLCIGAFGDTVALAEASERFRAFDLNLDGSGEGDFMAEAAEAFANSDRDLFQQAAARLEARCSLRGDALARELLYKMGEHLEEGDDQDDDLDLP